VCKASLSRGIWGHAPPGNFEKITQIEFGRQF